MMHNLDTNQDKWSKLLQTESSQEPKTMSSHQEESEIPEHVLEDSDTISIGVAKIAAKVARHEDRIAANSMRTRPAVRFEDPHTTITVASDSEHSEDGEISPEAVTSKAISDRADALGRESDFLGIPRPDGRRHSIATGLMPIPSAQLLTAAMGGGLSAASRSSSSLNVSEMVASSNTRMVGRTVIRRESLPSGSLIAGRALPSKTILHLQKLSKGDSGSSHSGELSPAESTGHVASSSSIVCEAGSPHSSDVPCSPAKLAEKSSCSSSTTDEILDFTFSLPEPGSRSSGSPRRSTLEATDLDELCPGTSILSMSPNVAHFTLQQSIDLEDQRRHLIRQQTCPVVSIHGEGGGKFDRPRFLSAAAAVSPTAIATSSIISQHRIKNKSPEAGGSGGSSGGEEGAVGGVQGRGSGGSSSEAIMQCGVISEEGDRGSGGSSAEASPLEIFVQQFPPGADDNDGEAPRRASSTGNLDPDQLNSEYNCPSCGYSVISSSIGNAVSCDCDLTVESTFQTDSAKCVNTSAKLSSCFTPADDQVAGCDRRGSLTQSTQTEPSEDDDVEPESHQDDTPLNCGEEAAMGISHMSANTVSISRGTSTEPGRAPSNMNRLATLLMWKNNRLWRSLTEEDHEENPCISDCDLEENENFYDRWNIRLTTTQQHQVRSFLFQREIPKYIYFFLIVIFVVE